METVSKKRGRPQAWHAAYAGMDALSSAQTSRGRQNFRLASLAIACLERHWEPAFAWFWRLPPATWSEVSERMRDGGAGFRQTALADLRRIEDDETMLAIARAACALPLETSNVEALRAIRRGRLGVKAGTSRQLSDCLCNAVDDFMKRFPKTTDQEIQAAVRLFRISVCMVYGGEDNGE